MTVIIGLTGGIASGKSTVAKMFRAYDIPVIDADEIAKAVVVQGTSTYKKIVQAFGKQVLQEDGGIDRAKLGAIIFNDEKQRNTLNQIVHPAVRQEMLIQRDQYIKEGVSAVVLDIPLLYESNLMYLVEKVLVVWVDEQTQLQRLMKRNNFLQEEAQARVHSQMSLEKKKEMADYIIDNTGSIENTEAQLRCILQEWGL
ncbi:dephospho-CoA kinase [Ectobacillus sp. JY-23]|uniref:dephospho-CoA kinase n=1 Tax=Ectobacillus sp. JY-23 TaxID=2933872 RepID=UPI001FF6DB68|nr:dephospho-CoA kinase [Ectobacillus sp. JY-23]UOY94268.1 dephospho-CoA kinase [Ectobacillus sp. JY-23]